MRGLGLGEVRCEQDALGIKLSFERVEPGKHDDVGVEVIDALGTEAVDDVLERGSLHSRAQFDQPVLENPRRQIVDRQLLDVDDAVERAGRRARAIRQIVAEHDVKNRLGVNSLDGIGQGRRLGQIVGGDASENVHDPSGKRRAGLRLSGGWEERKSRPFGVDLPP